MIYTGISYSSIECCKICNKETHWGKDYDENGDTPYTKLWGKVCLKCIDAKDMRQGKLF